MKGRTKLANLLADSKGGTRILGKGVQSGPGFLSFLLSAILYAFIYTAMKTIRNTDKIMTVICK